MTRVRVSVFVQEVLARYSASCDRTLSRSSEPAGPGFVWTEVDDEVLAALAKIDPDPTVAIAKVASNWIREQRAPS